MTSHPVTRTAWSPGQRVLTAGLLLMVTAIGFEGLAVPTILPAALEEFRGLPALRLGVLRLLAHQPGRHRGGWQPGRSTRSAATVRRRRPPLLCRPADRRVRANMAWIVAGRVVQGFGAGAIAAITYVIVARGYERAEHPRIIAIISSAWVIPGLVGPALAGYVAEAFSWRWTFLALAPRHCHLALLALAGPMRRLGAPEREPSAGDAGAAARRREAIDAVLLAVGAALMLAGLGPRNLAFLALALVAGLLLAIPPLRRMLPPGTRALDPAVGRRSPCSASSASPFSALKRSSRWPCHPSGQQARWLAGWRWRRQR